MHSKLGIGRASEGSLDVSPRLHVIQARGKAETFDLGHEKRHIIHFNNMIRCWVPLIFIHFGLPNPPCIVMLVRVKLPEFRFTLLWLEIPQESAQKQPNRWLFKSGNAYDTQMTWLLSWAVSRYIARIIQNRWTIELTIMHALLTFKIYLANSIQINTNQIPSIRSFVMSPHQKDYWIKFLLKSCHPNIFVYNSVLPQFKRTYTLIAFCFSASM